MEFPKAFALMVAGVHLRRKGWNGAKYGGLQMYVTVQHPDANSANTTPYLYMVVGEDRAPWFPSNLDLFADDWDILRDSSAEPKTAVYTKEIRCRCPKGKH